MKLFYIYTDWSYAAEVRAEILYTLAILAGETRHKMPVTVADEIENLVLATLPIASLVSRSRKRIDTKIQGLLRSALHLGFAIAHDGIKYLKNIGVTAAGTRILFTVLRYAHLNNLSKLKTEVLTEFRRLEGEATRANFNDAQRWIEFERLDALALDGDPLPDIPEDIVGKISAAKR